jgi:hypothetical protein
MYPIRDGSPRTIGAWVTLVSSRHRPGAFGICGGCAIASIGPNGLAES